MLYDNFLHALCDIAHRQSSCLSNFWRPFIARLFALQNPL
jgi:hypothetical protein